MFPRFVSRMFFVLALSVPAFAQNSPNIAIDSDSLRTILGSDNSQCPGCGVVTNVRQIVTKEQKNPSSEIDVPFVNSSGAGDGTPTSPIFSTGKKLGGSANRGKRAGAETWRVTLRYDDGSYASFDQSDRPSVGQGDRVRVVSGRVEAQ